MAKQEWTRKREQQHDDVEDAELQQGHDAQEADATATRVVTQASTRKGDAADHGARDEDGGEEQVVTKDELMAEAQRRGIEGRSSMSNDELKDALGH